MTSSAREISDQLLIVAARDSAEQGGRPAELLTHLKLQKLLYYVQGFHLVMRDGPAFGEDILAWRHGPVVREVYNTYRGIGYAGIPAPRVGPKLPHETVHVIEQVSEAYGQFSAWRLRQMTHETPPWKNTPQGSVISHKAMREYFLTQLD
jgi:uncharacterized phage-associated protein